MGTVDGIPLPVGGSLSIGPGPHTLRVSLSGAHADAFRQAWNLDAIKPLTNSGQIPDDVFLAAVETARTARGHSTATRWDVAAVLAGHPEDVGVVSELSSDHSAVPQRIVLAKARRLYRRGKLTGCICGCRGEFAPVEVAKVSDPLAFPESIAQQLRDQQDEFLLKAFGSYENAERYGRLYVLVVDPLTWVSNEFGHTVTVRQTMRLRPREVAA